MARGGSTTFTLRGLAASALPAVVLAVIVAIPATASAAGGHVAGLSGDRPGLVPAGRAGDGTAAVAGPRSPGAGTPWTRSEMLDAEPLDPGAAAEGHAAATSDRHPTVRNAATPTPAETIPDPSAARYRWNGKLFFRIGPEVEPDDNLFACSGTVVSSRNRNVVITAGHCVVDPPTPGNPDPVWAYDVVFIPGYRNGDAPFGQFAAKDMITTRGFRDSGDRRYDIAAVSLKPNGLGRIGNLTGSRKIEFNADFAGRSLELFGYPTEPEPPFDGEQLVRCVPASLGLDPALPGYLQPYMAWPCDMTRGASGGGWILDGRYLASITGYGYDGVSSMSRRLFGPRFDSAALNVYTAKQIGGSADPTVRLVKRPPHRVRKRAVNFRVAGSGSTPVLFRVKLDARKPVYTGNVIKLRRLSNGRHVLRIRSIDQTRHLSSKTLVKKVRVLPKRR